MALWGNNDNVGSGGTVSLDYSTLVVTGAGTSFGETGAAQEGDVIRFGLRGDVAVGGTTLLASTQLTVAITTSNLPVTTVSVADTSSASVGDLLTFPVAAGTQPSTGNYFRNPITAIGSGTFDVQNGIGTEYNILDTTLSVAITNTEVTAGIRTVFVAAVTGIATGDLYTGSGLVNEPVTSVGGTFVNFGTTAAGAGAGLGTDALVGAAATFNRAGVGTGAAIDIIDGDATIAAGTFMGDAVIVSIANTQQLTIASTAGLSGAAIAGTSFYISQLPVYTIVDSHYSLNPALDGDGVNYDAIVYGVSTQDAENSQEPTFTTEYRFQDAGWVGVTTYLDNQGQLRVKSETLVAMSGITTGDQGIAYFTPVDEE